MPEDNNDNQNNKNKDLENITDITQKLYKQNLELAVRNKTLSLLRELYQISIQTLEPEELAGRVSALIQKILEMDLVVIYKYEKDKDCLCSLSHTASEKFNENFKIVLKRDLTTDSIEHPQENIFKKVFNLKTDITNGLIKLWPDISIDDYQKLEENNHIHSSLTFPLIMKGQIVGVLVMSLNREYDKLSDFEQESLLSIVNVIAVALDRSILDKQLKIANEKLKELDRRKTEFVSIASHQLRSPLTAVKGYSSMLLEGSYGELTDDVKGAVNVIFESSQRLMTVIEDFLNITRIELGRMKYQLSEFDLRNLAQNITEENKPSTSKKGLKISFEAKDGDYMVYGDTGKISQVISNIIDNSTKYTPEGSIFVNVLRVGDNVQVKVSDTGVGMDPEDIERIFKKFVRADGAGKVNISGTGLGMYVAKQIVDAHLGKVWAESEGKGKGSAFILELPHALVVDKTKVGVTELKEGGQKIL